MASIESRLSALEAGTIDKALRLIPIDDGETRAEAVERAGFWNMDLGRVVFVTALDERL